MSQSKDLNPEELSTVSGGVDYSAACPVFDTIRARFRQLIKEGKSPTDARNQTKTECWNQVLHTTI